jgi:hypothetical protein
MSIGSREYDIITDAAYALAHAPDDATFDALCVEMVEALQYARSIAWWQQFERPAKPKAKDHVS